MSILSSTYKRPLTFLYSAPTEDQVERAKVLAEDLLEVLRGEHAKARDAHSQSAQGGVYGGYAAYGGQAAGQDPYAAYYAVCLPILSYSLS